MILTLQAGESRRFPTAARYLNVLAADQTFEIENSELGLGLTTVKAGWILTVDSYPYVYVRNPHETAITLELQASQLQIAAAGGNAVTVANKIIVDRIEQGVSVTADATVENGTVTTQSPDTLTDVQDIKILPGQSAIIAASSSAKKRVIIAQNISAEFTAVRIGKAPSASQGLYLGGSLNAPSSLELESLDMLRAFNAGTTEATISVIMGVR